MKKPNRFDVCRNLVEGTILEEEGDIELASVCLGHFSFHDRQAIEFALRLLRNPDSNIYVLVRSLNEMLRLMDGENSVISHVAYLGLIQTLLEKVRDS